MGIYQFEEARFYPPSTRFSGALFQGDWFQEDCLKRPVYSRDSGPLGYTPSPPFEGVQPALTVQETLGIHHVSLFSFHNPKQEKEGSRETSPPGAECKVPAILQFFCDRKLVLIRCLH